MKNVFGNLVWSSVLAIAGLVAAMILQAIGRNSDATLAAMVSIGLAVLSLRDR